MGPSGSGKSTLFNMIGGLDKPTSGKVFIDEVDIAQLDAYELAWLRCRKIGYIFQTFNIIQVMTALENVTLPMIFAGVNNDAAVQKGMRLLELVGLGDRHSHKPSELSGGQQQRVAIARALANDPAIILADEPTGNLDLTTGEEIIALLKQLEPGARRDRHLRHPRLQDAQRLRPGGLDPGRADRQNRKPRGVVDFHRPHRHARLTTKGSAVRQKRATFPGRPMAAPPAGPLRILLVGTGPGRGGRVGPGRAPRADGLADVVANLRRPGRPQHRHPGQRAGRRIHPRAPRGTRGRRGRHPPVRGAGDPPRREHPERPGPRALPAPSPARGQRRHPPDGRRPRHRRAAGLRRGRAARPPERQTGRGGGPGDGARLRQELASGGQPRGRAADLCGPGRILARFFEEKFELSPVQFPRFWVPVEQACAASSAISSRRPAGCSPARCGSPPRRPGRMPISENITCLIPGSEPELKEELLLVEAFYDSTAHVAGESPGADEAVGAATLLELAAAFKETPPGRTVLLAATSGHAQSPGGPARAGLEFHRAQPRHARRPQRAAGLREKGPHDPAGAEGRHL